MKIRGFVEMKDDGKREKQTSQSGRRSTVKKIVLGTGIVTTSQLSGLPWTKKWTKPVVDSVVLPAHAQTSPADVAGY